ncbi:hypothetical protein V6N13_068410 [Hibiscus sabdariffa]
MPMAAGAASPRERAQPMGPAVVPVMQAVPAVADVLAKDTIISWFRGEFAAANAIIDALCGHLAQLQGGGGGGSEYEAVFAAIHSRRLNWIPVLQMQKYHSIADVTAELKKVAAKRTGGGEEIVKEEEEKGGCDGGCLDDAKEEKVAEKVVEKENEANDEVGGEEEEESPESDITDSAKLLQFDFKQLQKENSRILFYSISFFHGLLLQNPFASSKAESPNHSYICSNPSISPVSYLSFQAMLQGKENQVQSLGICHRIFNLIVNVRKHVTLGLIMPQGSTNECQQDEHARNGVQQPLISRAKG